MAGVGANKINIMRKIKVKVLTDGCAPVISDNGDWIDLRTAEEVNLKAPWAGLLNRREQETRKVTFESHLVPLGVAMQLPDGYEGHIVLWSSANKNFGIISANHIGIVDNSYKGDNDQWFIPVIALRDTTIPKGSRICQFRVALSQKATFWQRVRHLFTGGVKIELVDELGNPDRGGHGTSGVA